MLPDRMPKRGGRWRDHREVIDALAHKLPTGIQWVHLPHRLRRGGRLPAFDREAYKLRNTVERCINHLKQLRGMATRYEKTAIICLAGLHIAGIFLWSAR